MFVQRARQAHARSSPSEGKRETHGLLTTEGNFFYRPGSAAWYSWKDENGRGGQWPVVITRILAPPMRPDIVEVACRGRPVQRRLLCVERPGPLHRDTTWS